MRSLEASLGDHPMAMLRGIADLRGIPLATNVREDAAQQLAATLAAPGAVDIAVEGLSEGAQAAWAGLLAAGGQIKTPAFVRQYGAIRPIGPGRLERETAWRQPANAAEELWYNGLIYRAFADLGDGPLEYIYIPDELRPVKASEDERADEQVIITIKPAAPPAAYRETRNLLAVDACHLLAALSVTPLRVADSGRWRAADEEGLRKHVLLPDPVRLALLITLAQELDWLAPVDGRLVVQAQPATMWLRKSAWEQMSDLFRAWRSSVAWNDLRRVPSLRAEGAWQNDPLLAREALLGVMARLDGDEWYTLDDLVAHVKATDPDFQRPDGNYTGWYVRDVASEDYFSGFESWDEVEGRLLRFMVWGPLAWLGAVMTGPDEGDATTHFRLTTAGAYWIAGAALPELLPPAHLTVTEQFKVAAPLLTPLYDRFRLLRFTEPPDEPSDEPGQPTWRRMTRHSLAEARARGVEADKIIQFLQRASGRPLPPRVEAGLSRWSQHGGAVRVSRGAVLRVDDAATLAALRADPVVAPLLGEMLSVQAVLVREANVNRLLQALSEMGYTAKVD